MSNQQPSNPHPTRRDVLKHMAYVPPVILTLAAVPSIASGGSDYHGPRTGKPPWPGGPDKPKHNPGKPPWAKGPKEKGPKEKS
jgi:hypothetical protein